MHNLCSNDIDFGNVQWPCGNIPNKPIDELLEKQIESYLKFNPEYRFDRVEIKYHVGIYTATPIYKHKGIE
jgi:hypothetical protein